MNKTIDLKPLRKVGNNLPQKIILSAVFLVPALLLWTPNFSVGVIALVAIYSIHYVITHSKEITLNIFDKIVLFCFSSYLLVNLPNILIDTGNFRYIDAPIRILACFPIYILLKQELPKVRIKNALELGAIIGALGAFSIAAIQYFFLSYSRVDGFLFSINFGYLSCSIAFLNLCLLSSSKRKTLLLSGFSFAIAATILTLTRGAILTIPLLLGIWLFFNFKSVKKRYIFSSFIILTIASIISYQQSEGLKKRVDFTIHEIVEISKGNIAGARSSGGRLQLWYAATESLKESPLIGLTYPERESLIQEMYDEKKLTSWMIGVSRGHAHSQYFEMIASNGVLAVFPILMMLVYPIFISLRLKPSVFRTTSITFFTGICLFGLTEVLLQANLISVYFGFFMAIFLAGIHYGTADDITFSNNER
ncbi:O-antigen ligase family protein [Enterovibrio norvegicus]|uniref:O-antigen ligase family protein n=1 Tax=Enterovibrio norvegicus TaxID=188144 RepID=UPI003D14E8E2